MTVNRPLLTPANLTNNYTKNDRQHYELDNKRNEDSIPGRWEFFSFQNQPDKLWDPPSFQPTGYMRIS
jgi:hypothetical protein